MLSPGPTMSVGTSAPVDNKQAAHCMGGQVIRNSEWSAAAQQELLFCAFGAGAPQRLTLKVVGNWTVPSLNVFQLPYHTL